MKDNNLSDIKIGIIGIGLIGGSLAKALSVKGKIKNISAVDTSCKSLEMAYKDKIISSYSTEIESLKDRDVIFVCVSPGKTAGIIKSLIPWYKGLITDVASTKKAIFDSVCSYSKETRYIPLHPMAGSERTGYEFSEANIFENAPFIICRTKNTCSENEKDIELLRTLSLSVGGRPMDMDIEYHDRAVGLISHLPHIISYALVNYIRSSDSDVLKEIAAGGFRDITRTASADPELWADILSESGDIVSDLIKGYSDVLFDMSKKLSSGRKDSLLEDFKHAKEYRDNIAIVSRKEDRVQLWVDVDDRPGIIGKIALILGDNKINIKNINIQDNREYEGGCVRITLSSSSDAMNASEILSKENLNVRIVR